MKKKSFMTFVGLFFSMVLLAAPVTKDAARQKAADFLTKKTGNVAAARGMRPVSLKLQDNMACDELYVFNVGQRDGYVIISGDDCTADVVLGYADEGEILGNDLPENLRSWLQGYADQIKWMKEHGIQENEAAARRSQAPLRTAISPMLTCSWNQGAPYNNNCPEVLYNENPTRAATGCLATAAAQVMYWHQKKYGTETGHWTTTTNDIPSYESNFYPIVTWTNAEHTAYTTGNIINAKASTTIDWSKLSDTYPSTVESNAEVAKLMEYVGAGLKMGYGPESSASFSLFAPMLINYFGYNQSARFVWRYNYSYNDWVALMYDQLMNVGPVFFGGQSTGGGHAFVLDGYDEEDYFHVNWGWGGKSNGFFKLSVLYSEQQGIGGSSSKDGYNFFQNATIDVNPDASAGDANALVRMTVNDVWANAYSFNRASIGDNFVISESNKLHFEIYNYTGAEADFDFGWGLYKDNALVDVLAYASANRDINWGWLDYWFSVSFGAGLDDGVYQLIPISRKKDTGTWYKDYLSEEHYMEATINGTTLTLTRMGNIDLTASLTVKTASPIIGQPVTVTATVTNNGSPYSGDLILISDNGTPLDDSDDRELCAQQVEISQGKICDFDFTFVPNLSSYTVYLSIKNGNPIKDATKTFSVAPSSMTTGELTCEKGDYSLTGGDFVNGIYGTTVSGTVLVANSIDVDHTSGITISLYNYDGSFNFVDEFTTYETIGKNNVKALPFEFKGLQPNKTYTIVVCYKHNGKQIGTRSNDFLCRPGVTTYTADGTETIVAPTASVDVADDVVALDISGTDVVASVTPNSNPNTLYIVSGSVPSGLEGKNVVEDGVAATLTLTDGQAFFSPIDFTVTAAPTYTRQFSVGANGTNGWNTIVLPYEVASVKQGAKDIDWFHSSSDTGKHFWVKEFSNENGNTVFFNYADQMKAGTPYIIAVPGDTWGANWDLTNKDITFYGSAGAHVAATAKASVSGNSYKFAGTLGGENVTDMYVMNVAGNAFTKTSGSVAPFRAYFKPIKMLEGAGTMLFIASEDSQLTGINEMSPEPIANSSYYNLNGQRVSQPSKGLYIINGKKVVKK